MEKTILSFVSGTIVEKLVSGPIVIRNYKAKYDNEQPCFVVHHDAH
jgi:hypothetical protein